MARMKIIEILIHHFREQKKWDEPDVDGQEKQKIK